MENGTPSSKNMTSKRHWFLSKPFLASSTTILILGGWVGGIFLVSHMKSRPPIDVDDKKIQEFDGYARKEVEKFQALGPDDKRPENIVHKLTPAEFVNAAIHTTEQAPNIQNITIGEVEVDAFFLTIKQEVNSYAIKKGEEGFFETLSSSDSPLSPKIAFRFKSIDEYTSVEQYQGTYSGNPRGVATWEKTPIKTMTPQEYADAWGAPLYRPLLYLISNQTTLNDPQKPSSISYDSENQKYKVELNLSPIDASLRYVKQMRTMSGLEEYPVFDSINLNFVISSDLKIDTVVIDECYTVKKIISNSCHAKLTKKFKFDDIAIPDLDTPCNYEI